MFFFQNEITSQRRVVFLQKRTEKSVPDCFSGRRPALTGRTDKTGLRPPTCLLSVVYFIPRNMRKDSNFGPISSVCDFCLFSIKWKTTSHQNVHGNLIDLSQYPFTLHPNLKNHNEINDFILNTMRQLHLYKMDVHCRSAVNIYVRKNTKRHFPL